MTGPSPYRTGQTEKRNQSAKLEADIEAFLKSGGQISELETQRSEFRPTWEAYANSAYEDRGHASK